MGESQINPAEQMVSDRLAADVIASQESQEDLLAKLITVSGGVAEAITHLVKKTEDQTIQERENRDTLATRINETMDDAVGFIVDPIAAALEDLSKDITGGFGANAQTLGLAAGLLVGFRKEMTQGFTMMWEETGFALDLLGEAIGGAIADAADFLWTFFRDSVVPALLDGLVSVGQAIWDATPDWLKTALSMLHKAATWLLRVPIEAASWIAAGFREVFELFGWDGAVALFDKISIALDELGDWLGMESKDKMFETAMKMAAPSEAKAVAGIMQEGGAASDAFVDMKKLGGTTGQALHFASLARSDAGAAASALEVFRVGREELNMPAQEAYRAALRWFQEHSSYKGKRVTPKKTVIPTTSPDTVAADVASAGATDKTNKLLQAILRAQKAAEAKKKSPDASTEILDTVSSSDPLSGFVRSRG